MLDTLPLKHYRANFQAMMDEQPLPFGNMKGKILDKLQYQREFQDFDPILREHIPLKYSKFFKSPKRKTTSTTSNRDYSYDDDDDDDDDSIEYGRSSNNTYNLSPLKKDRKSPIGMKDSEKIVNDLFESDRSNYLRKPTASKVSFDSKTIDDDDYEDEISDFGFEQTHKIISTSVSDSRQAQKLNQLVTKISSDFQSLKRQNNRLEKENYRLKEKCEVFENKSNELEQENILLKNVIKKFKLKLTKYYDENNVLKSEKIKEQNSPRGTEKEINVDAKPTEQDQHKKAEDYDASVEELEKSIDELISQKNALIKAKELKEMEIAKAKLIKEKGIEPINELAKNSVTVNVNISDSILKKYLESLETKPNSTDSVSHEEQQKLTPSPIDPGSCPICTSHPEKYQKQPQQHAPTPTSSACSNSDILSKSQSLHRLFYSDINDLDIIEHLKRSQDPKVHTDPKDWTWLE